MSGLYPDAPGARIAYDLDGTAGNSFDGVSTSTNLTTSDLMKLNNEGVDTVPVLSSGGSIALIFPRPMDLVGVFYGGPNPHQTTIEVSANTTNGVDGTWTEVVSADDPLLTNNASDYRSKIKIISGPGSTGIRGINHWGMGQDIHSFHVYGHPTTETGDRLEFWHPTLDQPLHLTPAYLDWAEVPRGSVPTPRDVRIKNLASVLTAHSVVVSHDAITTTSADFVSAHSFSADGGATYTSTVSIPSLAPSAISGVIKIKYAPGSTDSLSLKAGRIITTTGFWA